MARLKVARYGYGDELDNQGDELEANYSKTHDLVNDIAGFCQEILDHAESLQKEGNFEEAESYADTIADLTNEIDSAANEIKYAIAAAKNCGIYNEGQLGAGNNLIRDIENELVGIQEEADNLARENANYEDDIEALLSDIQDAESKLNELDLEMRENAQTGANTRLRKLMAARSFPYICAVHDDISKAADGIQDYTRSIKQQANELSSYVGYNEEDANDILIAFVDQFGEDAQEITSLLDQIEEDMDIGYNMNERMVNGIGRKNDLIRELREKIDQVNSDIEDLRNKGYQLQDHRAELEDALAELEEAIANM